jgi:hypothetical protein
MPVRLPHHNFIQILDSLAKVKGLSQQHRFRGTGVHETGLLRCLAEKKAETPAGCTKGSTFSGPALKQVCGITGDFLQILQQSRPISLHFRLYGSATGNRTRV